MSITNTQLRGHCQCCGQLQAVMHGCMSQHGYTVKKSGMGYGWFSGVCSGRNYSPLQVSRDQADAIIAAVRKEAKQLTAYASALHKGTKVLGQVEDPRHWVHKRDQPKVMVQWSDLDTYYRSQVLESAIWSTQQRAKAGTTFADQLQALADKTHGTPLLQVQRAEAPAAILAGECRLLNTARIPKLVAKVTGIDRGRVYWQTQEDRPMRSWTGTAAWRKLTKVGE